jgi:hypothetical protein
MIVRVIQVVYNVTSKMFFVVVRKTIDARGSSPIIIVSAINITINDSFIISNNVKLYII